MNPRESGQKGGTATRDSHITLCPCWGHPIKSQFCKETAGLGGEATIREYGRQFHVNIGKMGGRGNTREKITIRELESPLEMLTFIIFFYFCYI